MFNTILTILIAAHVHNPQPLAYAIIKVSNTESVDPILMTQIIVAESNGNPKAINYKTGDYGLMQIHLDAHPEVGLVCAMVLECNLKAGAKIVKTLNRACEYNMGKREMTEKRLKKCLQYEERLSTIVKGGFDE